MMGASRASDNLEPTLLLWIDERLYPVAFLKEEPYSERFLAV